MLSKFSKTSYMVSGRIRSLSNSNPILFLLDLDLNFAIRLQVNVRTSALMTRWAGVAVPTGKKQTQDPGFREEISPIATCRLLGPANISPTLYLP